jgi:ribosomal protein L12E/L44/L45/RPP1/RPP2
MKMTAWETTTDDINIVLNAYGVKVSEAKLQEIHGDLDHDDIEAGVMYYDTIEVQTASMLSDIEDHLMAAEIIPNGPKQFIINEEDDL